jgi:hypothetical protein
MAEQSAMRTNQTAVLEAAVRAAGGELEWKKLNYAQQCGAMRDAHWRVKQDAAESRKPPRVEQPAAAKNHNDVGGAEMDNLKLISSVKALEDQLAEQKLLAAALYERVAKLEAAETGRLLASPPRTRRRRTRRRQHSWPAGAQSPPRGSEAPSQFEQRAACSELLAFVKLFALMDNEEVEVAEQTDAKVGGIYVNDLINLEEPAYVSSSDLMTFHEGEGVWEAALRSVSIEMELLGADQSYAELEVAGLLGGESEQQKFEASREQHSSMWSAVITVVRAIIALGLVCWEQRASFQFPHGITKGFVVRDVTETKLHDEESDSEDSGFEDEEEHGGGDSYPEPQLSSMFRQPDHTMPNCAIRSAPRSGCCEVERYALPLGGGAGGDSSHANQKYLKEKKFAKAEELRDYGKTQDRKVDYKKAQDSAIAESWGVSSKARIIEGDYETRSIMCDYKKAMEF